MHILLHVSDIHFGIGDPPKETEKMVAAVRGLVIDPLSITIVLTGDIVYSGKSDQYATANKYFIDLQHLFSNEFSCQCELVICPGNHDCNFPEDSAIRDLVIDEIRSKKKLPDSESMTNVCTSVQADFFDWVNSIEGNYERDLAWLREIPCPNGDRLYFRILNSAWMSQIKEQQGRLFFPVSIIPTISSGNIRVSILHHPYIWFESSNARELRRVLEDGSDIILTGHEHDFDEFTISRKSTDTTGYVEGGIFSGDKSILPSFNVIQIDPAQSKFAIVPFKWQTDTFVSTDAEHLWHPYICQIGSGAREQMLSSETRCLLEDPGLQLTHRAKEITLEDIFVPPDLRTYERFHKPSSLSNAIIPSQVTINNLFEDRFAYLLGDGQCGKTALSKTLFIHAIRRGLMPVLLTDGHNISPKMSRLKKTIEQAVNRQYQRVTAEEFWQLQISERVIIIDNFMKAELNQKGIAKVTEWLKKHFGRVYLIGGDMTQIEALIAMPEGDRGFEGFKRYEIRPFGHKLRDILIRRWITLGRELVLTEDEIHHQIRTTATVVNTILGNNLLPASPIYILIILQQMEANVPLDTSSGSYGYFYETILTIALNRTSDSPEDLDAKYTYLSELAWYMFKEGCQEIDEETLKKFSRDHTEGFHLPKSAEIFQQEIVRSRVIQPYYGNYRFIYGCFFYYFVARHLRDNIEDESCKNFIKQASRELHREEHANILIFLTYLTKSKSVIGHVLDCMRNLFKNIDPCDLSEHIDFINRIQNSVPQVVLSDVEPEKERYALLERMDQSEAKSHETKSSEPPELSDQEELELILSINRAIKALQVLGQILRNFSGSLRSELKNEITRECFDTALRVLNGFYQSLERHFEVTLTALADMFGQNFSELPERKRVDVAKEFVFFITELMCLATFRRISSAVGSEKLIRTYEDLERSYNNRATRFVQLSLRLDHCKRFPEKRVTELWKEVKDDIFGITLLRMIIAEHFHFFPRPFQTRQRVCEMIGISYQGTVRRQMQLPKK